MAALEKIAGGGLGVGGSLSKLAASAAGILVLSHAGFRLHEKERAVRETRGRVHRDKEGNPKIYMPGVRLMVPGLQNYRKISIQDQPFSLPQIFVSREDRKFAADGTLTWGVSGEGINPYLAMYKADTFPDLERRIGGIGRQAIWSALKACDVRVLDSADLRDEIYETVADKCADPMLEYGVEFRGLELEASETDASLTSRAIRDSGAGSILALAALQGFNGNGHTLQEGTGNGLPAVDTPAA